jgi:hypothetical protein
MRQRDPQLLRRLLVRLVRTIPKKPPAPSVRRRGFVRMRARMKRDRLMALRRDI